MATVPCIVMTLEQSLAVAGPSDDSGYNGSARLRPIRLLNGSYVLALNSDPNVLDDPAHESKWPLLNSYPQVDVDEGLWPVTDPTAIGQ